MSPLEKTEFIRAAFPPQGLFADKEWLLSPSAFPLDSAMVESLEKLGHRLHLFNRACNELYFRSIAGKQPAWIADYLDRGKPKELVEASRDKAFRHALPAVIRPDLVLTPEGFTIAELDTVPGGIGLTAWLNETYARLGADVIGGATGMIEGFAAIAPRAHILVSKEAAGYRPEIEWIAARTGQQVFEAETYQIPRCDPAPQNVYRFFEHFDLGNIPPAGALIDAARNGSIVVTPPFKPFLEEKMWFALFWLRPLREFWRRELGERHFLELQKHIPYTWILDPAPIPHHAVIPGLDINSWEELGLFTQKQRELILKISGFSELGWGSRSVVLGSDQPQTGWQTALRNALASFNEHPYILQRFHKARTVEHPFLKPDTSQIEVLKGKVRLCPYYFVQGDSARLSGALATICPADKKLLHGMKDAIMVPAAAQTTD